MRITVEMPPCVVSSGHLWVDTGVRAALWTSIDSTVESPPAGARWTKALKCCYCGVVQTQSTEVG